MNIFFLDRDVAQNAIYHTDSHVVKIILESCQMMATAYPQGTAPYKRTHANHPMSVWVRSHADNFLWTLSYCYALCAEYTYRFDKIHKSQAVADWYFNNLPDIPDGFTDPPRCFGQFVVPITEDVVTDYRNYYKVAKAHLFKWKNREIPPFITK